MIPSIAVLLTCHNRKNKTLSCLTSFYNSVLPQGFAFDLYLVDDGSTDGTSDAVCKLSPDVTIIQGNGQLFWAGGMRLAFERAHLSKDYDAYLLLNDDVLLKPDFFLKLLETKKYCFEKYHKGGMYSGTTIDSESGHFSYGGNVLFKGIHNPQYQLLAPTDFPQECHLANANVLYVEKEVVETIGFLDKKYTHGIADYDFSLRAYKAGFPVYIAPGSCGFCKDDHGSNGSIVKSLKERIKYLKSPLGLGYNEYLVFVKRHFPFYYPSSFIKLWFRTLFPNFYGMLKK
jgi:GT2 family glycosyltransferase